MQKYTPATKKSIQPVRPPNQILGANSGPRITLPGPTLPPELTRLQDASLSTMLGEKSEIRVKEAVAPAAPGDAPSLMRSLFVAFLLLAAALGAFYYLVLPRAVADAKPGPTAAETTPVAPSNLTGALASSVEVTGFRFVADPSKKSEVQYVVVNHSDGDLTDVTASITLRSAKAGQTVARFSFKIPTLKSFESKEMANPIEKSRSLVLPDWQDLRADIQIGQ
jgi:hypothetical protein